MEDDIVFTYGEAKAYRTNDEVLGNDINTHLVFILEGHQGDCQIFPTVSARHKKGFAFC